MNENTRRLRRVLPESLSAQPSGERERMAAGAGNSSEVSRNIGSSARTSNAEDEGTTGIQRATDRTRGEK